MTANQIRLAFNTHGLGDVVHAAAALRLYVARGYDVQIQVEPNKRWVWEAAGIPVYDGPDELPHHPYLYPDGFWDLSQPDHTASKLAHLFDIPELPKLGTREQVWTELCSQVIDASRAVSQQAKDEVHDFLRDLPKPIVLFHSKGTNWQSEKSIPDAVAFQVICDLVNSFAGSVFTLDWDARSPTLGHPRVRAINPYWSHLSTEQFGELCLESALLIGIDSGPFHLAQWFGIRSLFVSRQIPPVRCCLPSPTATYLVAKSHHEYWTERDPAWRFAEYDGDEATSRDIVLTALHLLEQPTEPYGMQINPENIAGLYTYRRVGYDERPMELLADGTIGQGAAGCERTWAIEDTPVGQMLTIYGEHGGATCRLSSGSDRVLRGRWLVHEKMPIELAPQVSITRSNSPSARRAELNSTSAIMLVMNWDANYDSIAEIVVPNRREYAGRHGYGLHIAHHEGSWGKLNAMLEVWDQAEWLWWLDTDACVTDLSKRLEDFLSAEADVIATADRNGISCGSMLIRTTDSVRAIFEDVLSRRKEFDWPNNLWEQNGLMWGFWKIADRIRILPQRCINSYVTKDSGSHEWQPGDFVFHCAGHSHLTRISLLSEAISRSHREDFHLIEHNGIWIRSGRWENQDLDVVRDVVDNDSYFTRLRQTYGENEVVVDIGAHIGSFAVKWHQKNPKAKIICIEACPENIPILAKNVSQFAKVIHAACSYETGELALLNSIKSDGVATGGSVVVQRSTIRQHESPHTEYWADYRPLRKVSLEQVMDEYGVGHIDVIKLDCEGSEFSILENSSVAKNARFICGEYHGKMKWDELRNRVFSNWNYGHMWESNDLGIFHLENAVFH